MISDKSVNIDFLEVYSAFGYIWYGLGLQALLISITAVSSRRNKTPVAMVTTVAMVTHHYYGNQLLLLCYHYPGFGDTVCASSPS